MSNKSCIQCGVSISECQTCVAKCTNCSSKCTVYFDTDCVWYNYNQPFKPSELTCLGIPSNTNLTTILKAIDSRMCTPIQIHDTDTVDLEWVNPMILTANVRIDPTSTLPYSIGPNGIKLDCCISSEACANVNYNINFSLGDVIKSSSFYLEVAPEYFTASDYLVSMNIQDATSMSNGFFTYLKYHNYMISSIGFANPMGSLFSMPLAICGKSVIDDQSQFVVELATSPYCRFFKTCTITTTEVEWSPRYGSDLNFMNPQMDDEPIFNGCLYFPDRDDNANGKGNYIRKWDYGLNRTITLSGNRTLGAISTITHSTGDVVLYPEISMALDPYDVLNNEPCLYVVTTTGCVCRISKTTNSNCDERKNWFTTIIAGSENANTFANGNGSVARFNRPNGIKITGYINGAPIFIISDFANNVVRLLWFNGGNKSSNLDWEVATLPCNPDPVNNNVSAIGYTGSYDFANINYDRSERKIYTHYYNSSLGKTIICVTELHPLFNTNNPIEYLTASNYIPHYAMYTTANYGSNTINTNGYNAPAKNIIFVNKIKHNIGGPKPYCFVYCEIMGTGSSIYMNAFYPTVSNPNNPSHYNFETLISNNAPDYGNLGDFNGVANACCYGMYNIPSINGYDYIGFSDGGFRVFDMQTSKIASIATGRSNSVLNYLDILNIIYDTQYFFVTTC